MSPGKTDTRTPSPPYGYSRECHYPLEQQIRIVAEFYVHNIRPSRIAYRMGIDIDLVEQLIAGEVHQQTFEQMVSYYRKSRRKQRLRDTQALTGSARVEQQARIEAEFKHAQSMEQTLEQQNNG
ncbi:MAG: hypothetical protein ABJ308_19050 [Halieaceae bacterium]